MIGPGFGPGVVGMTIVTIPSVTVMITRIVSAPTPPPNALEVSDMGPTPGSKFIVSLMVVVSLSVSMKLILASASVDDAYTKKSLRIGEDAFISAQIR